MAVRHLFSVIAFDTNSQICTSVQQGWCVVYSEIFFLLQIDAKWGRRSSTVVFHDRLLPFPHLSHFHWADGLHAYFLQAVILNLLSCSVVLAVVTLQISLKFSLQFCVCVHHNSSPVPYCGQRPLGSSYTNVWCCSGNTLLFLFAVFFTCLGSSTGWYCCLKL